ncbi:MAG: molybdenum cofactor biosynthesis protein [Deferribacteraceae bacterium]|jgi:molybdenum cofactor synthesis domain-containing protein|nr:molybdenum cofactor biosynthesis protein [Deferribacteraceae bacterium]
MNERISGKIGAISVSEKKGVQKTNVETATLIADYGLEGDAHAGKWHRQVSLLAQESIDKIVAKGLNVKSGDFAENITTIGIDIPSQPVGGKIAIGDTELVISQIGKVCHHRCAIYHKAGDCVMPREGIFGVALKGGKIRTGDPVTILPKNGISAGIITLSDRASQGAYEDLTGPVIEKLLNEKLKCAFIRKEILSDEQKRLEMTVTDFADTQKLDIIITNGSTGVSPRDIAPEALLNVIQRRLPGFEEIMRMESFKKTVFAVISRAVCGIRGESLIISLPGSPKAAFENLSFIIGAISHTVEKIHGDPSSCAAL